jgi:hypothetical protein
VWLAGPGASVMPGRIQTNFARHLSAQYVQAAGVVYTTIEHGAATSVLLATWPPLEHVRGRYFDDRNEAPVVTSAGDYGVAPFALDSDNATASGKFPSP